MSGFLEYYNVIGVSKERKSTLSRVRSRINQVFPLHLITFFVALPISGITLLFSGDKNELMKFRLKAIVNLSMLHGFIPDSTVYFSFNAVSWYLSLVLLFAITSNSLCKICSIAVRKLDGKYWICIIWSI